MGGMECRREIGVFRVVVPVVGARCGTFRGIVLMLSRVSCMIYDEDEQIMGFIRPLMRVTWDGCIVAGYDMQS